MLKNLYGFSFKDEYEVFTLPRYLTIGVSRKGSSSILTLDSEYIFGTFSGLEKKRVDIWFLRGGLEKKMAARLTGRMGLIYPVIAKTSTLGNVRDDMPWPKIGATIGAGLIFKKFLFDLSIYGDPAKSYVEQKPTLSSVISATIVF